MKPIDNKSKFFLIAVLVLFAGLALRWWPAGDRSFSVGLPADGQAAALYHEQFISFAETPVVHAPAITQRKDGMLLAVWYAGTREGASDVAIHATLIDPATHTQSPPQPILTPDHLQKQTWRYIRKLGNPVVHTLPDGRLMLLSVSVSFGGWAASSLNLQFSADGGQTWGKPKRLITSPFLNISTLVKGTPIDYENGDIGVPVYHELFGKYGEILILDPQGHVKDKQRLSWGRDNIQPVVTVLDERHAVTLMRDSGEQAKRVFASSSQDGGGSWSTPSPTDLPNPNAAVATAALDESRLIMVFNNDEEERFDLSLAVSNDLGQSWRVIHRFEDDRPTAERQKVEFSYPYLIRDLDGGFHLVYTWHKQRIKYVHFNRAWLEQKL